MHRRKTTALVIGAVGITATVGALGFEASQTRGSPTEMFDVVLANGRVIDPETQLDAVRNVGITDGHIAAVSLKDKTDNQKFPVSAEVPGRWVRLTLKNNHGARTIWS